MAHTNKSSALKRVAKVMNTRQPDMPVTVSRTVPIGRYDIVNRKARHAGQTVVDGYEVRERVTRNIHPRELRAAAAKRGASKRCL